MNTDTHISTEPEASEPQALSARVIAALGYEPNDQQRAVIEALARFVAPLTHPQAQTGPDVDAVFVLNGYAGTGKTSLTAALTRALADIKVPSILMAPTGRAAKVFAGYAHHTAYTIHRKIYRHSLGGEVPGLQENKAVGTLFIVDEASMISGGDPQGREDLLGDLIQYVYAGQGCRMLLIGDTAQLPPVGMDCSPAMDPEVLHAYGLRVSRATLTAIARQRADSGILANATMLRRAMRDAAAGRDELRMPTLLTNGFSDIDITSPEELPEAIESAYRDHGIDHTLVITRSNMRAAAFNRAIRADVLYIDTAIAKGEPLIVVKNNYRCARSVKGLDFVANGDMAIVSHIYSTETRYGMHWADVRLALTDRNIEFDAKITLDTLVDDTPALSREKLGNLASAILAAYDGAASMSPRQQMAILNADPYFDALQVKFGYTVTCHKAQGGQWNHVFVDMCGIAPDAPMEDFYRWLYTAVTRARRHLTIIAPQQY